METAHGLRLALTTDPSQSRVAESTLTHLYKLYAELVVKNPLYTLGEPITSPTFASKVDSWIESLPFFH